jgi:hypothetical protein
MVLNFEILEKGSYQSYQAGNWERVSCASSEGFEPGANRKVEGELLELQAKIGIQLIRPEEVQAIQELWND